MSVPITAAMLYDLVNCSHRVSMDIYGDHSERDSPNAFIQLLWERGTLYEKELISGLTEPFLDLSGYSGDEKERLTSEAIEKGESLIYCGRISADDLLGEPDLLRREGEVYIAGDIKSGRGEQGPEDNPSPKKHYAVQLGLYTDILERKGIGVGRRAFILDIHGDEVPYEFDVPYGTKDPRTLWQDYQEALGLAQGIVTGTHSTTPAYSSGDCKLCHWYRSCMKRLERDDDLTLLPELGRSKRDVMLSHVSSIAEFASSDPEQFVQDKRTIFPGIGIATLGKLHDRAKLLSAGPDAKPYLRAPVSLPTSETELFFDIEVDPMRDICYLHGFVERRGGENSSERFVYFFAEEANEQAEEQAFSDAIAYLRENADALVYYYSKYERTIYRKLCGKYPGVCSSEEIEELFDPARAIDLYNDVVKAATEWPTRDFSIKSLATYLGFGWRDTHPSGAASIEWFDRWIKTGDPAIRQRILDYNEDDCRATRVLLDGIREL